MLNRIVLFNLTIIICLCYLFSINSYGQVPTPTKTSNEPEYQTNSSQQNPAVIGTVPSQPVPAVPLFIAPDTKIKTTNETQNKNDKTTADWWLVYFTAALVAVVFMQFIWMVRQEKWMRRNVEISQKSADAAKESTDAFQSIERARLFVKVERDPPPKQGELIESVKEGYNRVRIIIINEGKSLAILTKINLHIGVIDDKDIDDKISELKSRTSEYPYGVITISSSSEKPLIFDCKITKSDLQKINESTVYYLCLGHIRYKDVFRKVRQIVFCWKDNGTFFFPDPDPTRNDYT